MEMMGILVKYWVDSKRYNLNLECLIHSFTLSPLEILSYWDCRNYCEIFKANHTSAIYIKYRKSHSCNVEHCHFNKKLFCHTPKSPDGYQSLTSAVVKGFLLLRDFHFMWVKQAFPDLSFSVLSTLPGQSHLSFFIFLLSYLSPFCMW
jgi:hypothetical protein